MSFDRDVDFGRWSGLRVAVAVPDITRPFDVSQIGKLVERLARNAAKVDVIVALGLHRAMTDEELRPLCAVLDPSIEIHQHDANDPRAAPFHPIVAEADSVVCVGIVEPHQYAGFSGGVKTVSIGCASATSIGETHGLALLRDPGTRVGAVHDNPFQAALWARASALEDVWAYQTVPSGEVFFGPAREAFDRAVAVAQRTCFESWSRTYDWVRLPVPAAKARSFYQASRAATYLALASSPVIVKGGTLVVEASCPEGLGIGAGERAFERALDRGLETLRAELRGGDRPLAGGAQRAYVLARVLEHYEIAVVGAAPIEVLARIGVRQARSFEDLALPGEGRTVQDVFARLPLGPASGVE